MSTVSKIETAAFILHPLWTSSIDSRDELGNLIISRDIESAIDHLMKLVEVKKKKISNSNMGKVGRKLLELPPSQEIRQRFLRLGTITAVAKELGCHRKTILRRMREQEGNGKL
jgi:hypothetical protein